MHGFSLAQIQPIEYYSHFTYMHQSNNSEPTSGEEMINNRGILSRHQYSTRMCTISALNILTVFKDMETISQIILVYIVYSSRTKGSMCDQTLSDSHR